MIYSLDITPEVFIGQWNLKRTCMFMHMYKYHIINVSVLILLRISRQDTFSAFSIHLGHVRF